MLVACLALVVALGGTGYAALRLPANSVGAKQLRKGSVTNKKLAKGAVTAAKVAKAIKDGGAGVASLRTLGTGALQAMPGTAHPGGPPSGAAGGALSGSYPSPTIANGAVTGAALAPGARTSTLKSGETIAGFIVTQGYAIGEGSSSDSGVGFQILPQHPIPFDNRILVSGASAPHCPGTGQAAAGYLCVYQAANGNTNNVIIISDTGGELPDTRLGFGIQTSAAATGNVIFEATWAYTQA